MSFSIHEKNPRVQIALILVFLFGVYLASKQAAYWMGGKADWMDLQEAIQQNDMEWLHRLLRNGANVNVRYPGASRTGRTALQTAITKRNWEAAELLLEYSANPNPAPGFRSLLFETVASNIELSRRLIECGAYVDVVDKDGYSPLHLAAGAGNAETVRMLVEAGAPLHGISTGRHAGTPTYLAVNCRFKGEAAEYLIRHIGPAITRKENTVKILVKAVERGHARSVAALIDLDPTLGDWLRRSHPAVLTRLVERDDPRSIATLLDQGFDPNAPGVIGETALHAAARYDAASAAETLIERGADIDACTPRGDTPLLVAVDKASPRVLEVLLKHGADVSITNFHKMTPLHKARLRSSYHRERGIWDDTCEVYEILERHVNAQKEGVGK